MTRRNVGETNAKAKLTSVQVLEMRELFALRLFKQKELAELKTALAKKRTEIAYLSISRIASDFGVVVSCASKIKKGHAWAHLINSDQR